MAGEKVAGDVALDPRLDFLAGTIAGAAAIAVGHPFDTVKVRFQNPSTAGKYSSTFHALTTIVREEGPRGLFKGMASPMASAPILNGFVFAIYGFLMKAQLRSENAVPTLTQVFLAGAGCGILSSAITTPIELVKICQQQILEPTSKRLLSGAPPNIPSTRELARRIYRERGIAGLYRGISATAYREIGFGSYFAAYEASTRFFSRPRPGHDSAEVAGRHPDVPWYGLLISGGFAGAFSWFTTFPFDVVKTRMQSSADGHPRPYRNTWSTIVASYRAEGAGVFFRGLAPTLIRAIPVNMVTFSTFELVVNTLS
ncbi:mitochondrial carrier [Peniophora sp. CONT]|nr:mitochondrial carrier [Peniophora sp. CONT]